MYIQSNSCVVSRWFSNNLKHNSFTLQIFFNFIAIILSLLASHPQIKPIYLILTVQFNSTLTLNAHLITTYADRFTTTKAIS